MTHPYAWKDNTMLDRSTMATIASLVVDGMNPEFSETQRLTALNRALALNPVTALAMATSMGQSLIGMLGEFGLNPDSVISNLHLQADAFRTQVVGN